MSYLPLGLDTDIDTYSNKNSRWVQRVVLLVLIYSFGMCVCLLVCLSVRGINFGKRKGIEKF